MANKMMPGEKPYTDAEWKSLTSLVASAAKAYDYYSEDELEEAAEQAAKEKS